MTATAMTGPTPMLTWRRHWDGAEFSGAFERDLPAVGAVVCRVNGREPGSMGHRVVVHRTNVLRGEGRCAECGATIEPGYEHRPYKECCFGCSCWRAVLADDRSGHATFAIVDGHHYTVGDENALQRGHDGETFEIRFADGRVLRTSNLWSQGVIPARFRERMPDNAVRVARVERRAVAHA